MQYPPLSEGFFAGFTGCLGRDKIVIKFAQDIFRGLIYLVTKSSISMNNLDIKVDIATYFRSVVSEKIWLYGGPPPVVYATNEKRRASAPHSGMPLGNEVF